MAASFWVSHACCFSSLLFFFFSLLSNKLVAAGENNNDMTQQRQQQQARFIFVTNQSDVYDLVSQIPSYEGLVTRVGCFADALGLAETGDCILLMADGYPFSPTSVNGSQIEAAAQLNVSLYLEYPLSLPGVNLQHTPADYYHRLVVKSQSLEEFELPPLSILMAHSTYFANDPANLNLGIETSHLVYAQVAGYDYAVYGLPDDQDLNGVLFDFGGFQSGIQFPQTTLVALTKLSDVVQGRVVPMASWTALWSFIFSHLGGEDSVPTPRLPPWLQTVSPMYTETEILPDDAELIALSKVTDWFYNYSGVLTVEENPNLCPAPYAPQGVNVTCVLEGVSSLINPNGTQDLVLNVRMDCNAESAMALAYRGALNPSVGEPYFMAASNILDYIYFYSEGQQGIRANSSNPAYGLVVWGVSSPDWLLAWYGDDQARGLLAGLTVASLLETSRWDTNFLLALFASLRTTGPDGFHAARINFPDLESNGWEYYFNTPGLAGSPQPHYQAELWSVFLLAYNMTGIALFRDRATLGILSYMSLYPNNWRWTEYFTEEQSRMILALSFLVRVNDTSYNRALLRMVSDDLLTSSQPSGGVKEMVGWNSLCDDCPPPNNQAFGSGEGALIQDNSNTAYDMLYDQNFLVRNLREAYYATGDEFYSNAEDRLASMLVRIQTNSSAHPSLDGAWYRAFDFQTWEYFASSTDWGWGPWSIETGWTHGWIASTLALRNNAALGSECLWDLVRTRVELSNASALCSTMLPAPYCAQG